MTQVKICGVTRVDDAVGIAGLAVDYIGLNFWSRSKRCVNLEAAEAIARAVAALRSAPKLVGVFVDPTLDEIVAVTQRLELAAIQLHGGETSALCVEVEQRVQRPVWKAVPVAAASDIANLDRWPVAAILLDAPSAARGGAGIAFDHHLARQARDRYPALPLVLAGGLNAGNVAAAVELVQPWCVDVASGVEAAPGVKDLAEVAAFVAAARRPPTRP